jgi:hypothetical protein
MVDVATHDGEACEIGDREAYSVFGINSKGIYKLYDRFLKC